MLDIVVTHYMEPWDICKKLFYTLEMQRCISWEDIRVTVINDGGHMLPGEKLKDLSFQVNQVNLPHGGVSRARNEGLDLGSEPWVMFCDCDDCFFNIYALEDIMNVLKSPVKVEERFDMLWTHCWEESPEGLVSMIPGYRVFVFCHGKVYNRAFLKREGIRFEEGLTFNEDSCFNAVIIARTVNSRIGEIKSQAPVYTWIRRPGSVTLREGADDIGTICNFRRNLIVTEENRLHKPEQYANMVARTAYDAFYMIHSRRITDPCKQEILEEFRPRIREKIDEIGNVTQEMLDGIRSISSEELTEDGEEFNDQHEEVLAWLKEVSDAKK